MLEVLGKRHRNKVGNMERPPSTFSSRLFVNATDAYNCPICFKIFTDPVQCKDGHIFCRECLVRSLQRQPECPMCRKRLTPSTICANLFVKNIIHEAEVYCFTRLRELDEAGDSVAAAENGSESTNVAGVKRKHNSSSSTDHCIWTGKLQDATKHFNECEYSGITCAFHDCGTVVMRKNMAEHESSCPFRTQPCKWCKRAFLVDDPIIEHESVCVKRDVQCIHDHQGCTAVMSFDKRRQHVARDCPFETVSCPFLNVGCNERMMRKDIDGHEVAAMKQHNRLLLQGMQTLQQKSNSIEIMQRNIQQNQLHQITYKVNVADLVANDAVTKMVVVGTFYARLTVRKGRDQNDVVYGVFLRLQHGPFPCLVTSTIKVVPWIGDPADTTKRDFTHVYEKTEDWGWPTVIRQSQLTDAVSPYVKNGEITFIMTCRIDPM